MEEKANFEKFPPPRFRSQHKVYSSYLGNILITHNNATAPSQTYASSEKFCEACDHKVFVRATNNLTTVSKCDFGCLALEVSYLSNLMVSQPGAPIVKTDSQIQRLWVCFAKKPKAVKEEQINEANPHT